MHWSTSRSPTEILPAPRNHRGMFYGFTAVPGRAQLTGSLSLGSQKKFSPFGPSKVILWEWIYLGSTSESSADHSGWGISQLPVLQLKFLITCKIDVFFLNFKASAMSKTLQRDT